MLALPWIKLSVHLPDDPRVAALARHLSVERATALGLVATLLTWTARFYPTGTLPGGADGIGAVEVGCWWPGKPGEMVAGLVAAGFLTRSGPRFRVSNWSADHAAHAERMERDRERMRAKRAETREVSRTTVERRSHKGSHDGRGEIRQEKRREEEKEEADASPSASPPSRQPKEPDPRITEWTTHLVSVYAEVRGVKYHHQGAKDAQGIKSVIGAADGNVAVAEVRWRRGLALGAKYPGVATLAALASRWNDLATEPGRNGSPAPFREPWQDTARSTEWCDEQGRTLADLQRLDDDRGARDYP